jgi:hypothetical protein
MAPDPACLRGLSEKSLSVAAADPGVKTTGAGPPRRNSSTSGLSGRRSLSSWSRKPGRCVPFGQSG